MSNKGKIPEFEPDQVKKEEQRENGNTHSHEQEQRENDATISRTFEQQQNNQQQSSEQEKDLNNPATDNPNNSCREI